MKPYNEVLLKHKSDTPDCVDYDSLRKRTIRIRVNFRYHIENAEETWETSVMVVSGVQSQLK